VLILREVLAWSAQEVADLLDTSIASVNSKSAPAPASIPGPDPDAYAETDPARRPCLATDAGGCRPAGRRSTEPS
jgi:RNA polymerase sigma-70 factor (ECF subfamily)